MSPAEARIPRERTSDVGRSREQTLVAIVGSALALALALVLFVFGDLPMLDLPQHAVQVATWLRWEQLAEPERASLELNLRTPYLLAYPLAYALSPLLGVLNALKLLVLLSTLGNVLALGLLARRLGHSPWLCLLGLPLSFGFSFFFGFVSFLFATPLVIASLLVAFAYAVRPRWSSGLGLAALLCLTLIAHGFAFAIGALSVGLLLLFGVEEGSKVGDAMRELGSSPGARWKRATESALRLAPLLAPATLALSWLAPTAHGSTLNDWSLPAERWFRWLPMILGVGSFRDSAAVVLGLTILCLIGLCLGRVTRAPGRLGLLAVAVAGYALVPELMLSTGFLHERCVGFLLPGLMLACQPSASNSRRSRFASRLIPAACAIWLAVFTIRLSSFNREMAHYHALVDKLPAGLRVRPLIFQRDSPAFPGVPAYLHVSAYYHVENGGAPAYWFAVQRNSVVRYRNGCCSQMTPGSEWVPEAFDVAREAPDYDYFLVHGEPASRAPLFEGSPVPIVLDACHGNFCGYRSALPPGETRRHAAAYPNQKAISTR